MFVGGNFCGDGVGRDKGAGLGDKVASIADSIWLCSSVNVLPLLVGDDGVSRLRSVKVCSIEGVEELASFDGVEGRFDWKVGVVARTVAGEDGDSGRRNGEARVELNDIVDDFCRMCGWDLQWLAYNQMLCDCSS